MSKFSILFLFSLFSSTSFFISFCSSSTSLSDRINYRLALDKEVDKELLSFRVSDYDSIKRHIILHIRCNFDKVKSSVYLRELTRAEVIILSEGINSISYSITKESGGLELSNKESEENRGLEKSNALKETERDKKIAKATPQSPKDKNEKKLKKHKKSVVSLPKKPLVNKATPNKMLSDISKDDSISVSKKPRNDEAADKDIVIVKKALGKRAIVSSNFVNLRKKPSLKAKIITYLFFGVVVKVLDRGKLRDNIASYSDFWYKVESLDKKSGWVFGAYLKNSSVKNVSSYLDNNIIYNDFLNRKGVLLTEDIVGLMKEKKYSVDIAPNLLTLRFSPGMEVFLPFRINDVSINWNLDKMSVKGDLSYLYGARVSKYDKNNYTIDVELEKNAYKYNEDSNNGIESRLMDSYPSEEDKKGNEDKEDNADKGVISEPTNGNPSKETKDANKLKLSIEEYQDNVKDSRLKEKDISGDKDANKKDRIKEDGIEELIENGLINRSFDGSVNNKLSMVFSSDIALHSMADYNIELKIDDSLKKRLVPYELRQAIAVMKIVEARLLTKDYNKNVNFHYKFSSFYDTISICLYDIDFSNKLASFRIKREGVNPKLSDSHIMQDELDIDFKVISEDNKSLNYERFGELYYSEILQSMSGISSKEELIGLANFLVKYLLG